MKLKVFISLLSLGTFSAVGFGVYEYARVLLPNPADTWDADVSTLSHRLVEHAEKKNFKGAVAELESVEGIKDEKLGPALTSAINSELSQLFPQMIGGASARQAAARQVNDILKEKAWMDKTPDIKRISPDFFLMSTWNWIIPHKSFQISLRLVRCSVTADFVEVSQIIAYPSFVKNSNAVKDKAQHRVAGCVIVLMLCLIACLFCVWSIF